MALGEIGFHPLNDHLVIEQPIEFAQFGLEVSIQLRDEGEEVDRRMAIDKHAAEALRDAPIVDDSAIVAPTEASFRTGN